MHFRCTKKFACQLTGALKAGLEKEGGSLAVTVPEVKPNHHLIFIVSCKGLKQAGRPVEVITTSVNTFGNLQTGVQNCLL